MWWALLLKVNLQCPTNVFCSVFVRLATIFPHHGCVSGPAHDKKNCHNSVLEVFSRIVCACIPSFVVWRELDMQQAAFPPNFTNGFIKLPTSINCQIVRYNIIDRRTLHNISWCDSISEFSQQMVHQSHQQFYRLAAQCILHD